MGFLDSFRIPGNVKQIMLPFVLDPMSSLNIGPGSESKKNNQTFITNESGAQHFSFRNLGSNKFKAGFGRLQVLPSSLMLPEFGNLLNDDISYKLLYPNKEGDIQKKSIVLDDIFNSMPSIQIREFLPDTRLDQLINFFGSMIETAKDVFKGDSQDGTSPKKTFKMQNVTLENMKKFSEVLIQYCTQDMFGEIKDKLDEAITQGGNSLGVYKKADHKFNYNNFILSFPYQLYYRLQSCTTTNIYTLPGVSSDKLLYSSKGNAGWDGGKSIGLGNEFTEKIPVLGKLAKTLLGNIQVHYMPWWNPESGSGTQPPEIQLTVNLFNDTAEAAMINFIFVNTIVPNNMWIQYGMFQHASDLYDVKIEGFNRLFACSGSFNVKGKGVFRDPPKDWVRDLVYKHGNWNDSKSVKGGQINTADFVDVILKNKLIKIPDVYEVTMQFGSLLPLNFNNYLYTYSQNNTIETSYTNENIWQQSVFNDIVNPAIKGIATAVKKASDAFKSEDTPKATAPKTAAPTFNTSKGK